MPTEKQIHEGHRRRMYARVERDGFDSLAPHEALEYLLYFTNARRDTNALAHALLDRFGDFASVLEASEEDLMQVDGIGPTTARLLHGLLPVSRYYARTCAGKKRSLNTTESLAEFLQAQFLHLQQERAMLISLNRSRQVRSAVWLREGGRQAVWLDIQEIVTAALKGGTSVVVLCHNHPNGMVLPSMEDMRATGEVVRALDWWASSLLTISSSPRRSTIRCGSRRRCRFTMRRRGYVPLAPKAPGVSKVRGLIKGSVLWDGKTLSACPSRSASFWHSAWHLWCCAVCWLCSLQCQRRNLRSLGL